MKITLGGNQAHQFSYESVYNTQEKDHIVVLFVGCLPKQFTGISISLYSIVFFDIYKKKISFCKFQCLNRKPYLSGGAAYQWYFNPEIPEAGSYYTR
jgi:hypothetical protein